MTAKEYISQITRMEAFMETKRQRVATMKMLAANPGSVNLTGMPRNPSPSQSPMASIICKAVDLEAEIQHDEEKLAQKKMFLLDQIGKLKSSEGQTVLIKRYFEHKPYEDIADSLHYSNRWVYRIHDKAISELDTIMAEAPAAP